MKKLVLLTAFAFATFISNAQQAPLGDIEAIKRDKLQMMLAEKSAGYGSNQVTDNTPEQDCIGAITVCQTIFYQPNSYIGEGVGANEINPSNSCLGAGELNGVWYKILVTNDGLLGFNLTPNDATNDYDWAIYNITNATCSDIFNNPALEVSCNFSGSTFPVAVTGPNNGENPQDEAMIPVLSGEIYAIYISNFSTTNQSGYSLDFSPSTIALGNCSYIYGSIYLDNNANCQLNVGDEALPGQVVYMLPGPLYGISDANGLYRIGIPQGQTGTYQLFTQPLSPGLNQTCPYEPSYFTVQVNNTDSLYPGNNFAYRATDLNPCPVLTVSNLSTVLRSCCDNSRYLQVCNVGSGITTNGYLELTYMDNYIEPTAFYINGLQVTASQNNNIYTINLPNIPVGECVNLEVVEIVTDSSYVGQTACVLAHSFPDNDCGGTSNWDASITTVSASCNNDNTVLFTLQNIGTGNMAYAAPYTIYNGVDVAQSGTYQLQAGQSETYTLPANGDLYVLQAEQTENNPFGGAISGFVDGCGNGVTAPTATFNMFGQNYGGTATDMDCALITNSYDPNDKQAVPEGITPQHFISATDVIEYKIRFQNTGTAAADKVVIVDTLDFNLDPGTLVLGAASHPYSAELVGSGIIIFTFNNINLPPLSVDENGSMGAVTFKIGQKWGLPINYSIYNTAEIYFDQNPAIVTNTVFHNVKDNTTNIAENKGIVGATIYPNPTAGSFTLALDALKTGQSYTVAIYTTTGALVKELKDIRTAQQQVDVANLSNGLYYYRLLTSDGKTAAGRFVKE